jgi:hypothetical protein
MQHLLTSDNSEPLCGLRDWRASGDSLAGTYPCDCRRCNAHHRCKTGQATNEDRLLLAHPGYLPANAGRMFGPTERDKSGRLTRLVWRLVIPGEIPLHAQRESLDAYTGHAEDTTTAPTPVTTLPTTAGARLAVQLGLA